MSTLRVFLALGLALVVAGCSADTPTPGNGDDPTDSAGRTHHHPLGGVGGVEVPVEDHSGHLVAGAVEGEGVGRVHFPVACEPLARERIEVGLAMFHSFWFGQADGVFQEALALDPACGMAEWGRAITRMGNPYAGAIPEARRSAAREALDRAEAAGLTTPRERDWVAVFRPLFAADGSEVSRRLAWEAEMEEMVRRHPEDPEVHVFLGLALLAAAPPEDTTFARQLRAAAMLEDLFLQRPDHPGLAHYIIHAYDAPALAERGLDAALRYAEIAPDAPHALHMPSHIFTRLGMWDRSIEVNLRSAAASGGDWERVHAWDYLVYAYLQQGRDREAAGIVRRALTAADALPEPQLAWNTFNWQAMSARLALELGDWESAAALPPTGEGMGPAVAIRHFARGLGMARIGDRTGAQLEVARLEEIRDALEVAGEAYWSRVVEAQTLAVQGWIHRDEGDAAGALLLLDRAALLEEEVEKHPVTPGPLLPAREMHGELLLAEGDPAGALASFRRVLEREPHRGRATFLAGLAALEAGDPQAAEGYFDAYGELTARGDGTRSWDRAARQGQDS